MIPLIDIKDDETFYCGIRLRKYNIGLNVKDKSLDFYEYMLAELPGENEYMLLTCVEGHKSGYALALVKVRKENPNTINGKALKFSFGIENAFLLETEL